MAEKTGLAGRELAGRGGGEEHGSHTQPSCASAICQAKQPEVGKKRWKEMPDNLYRSLRVQDRIGGRD